MIAFRLFVIIELWDGLHCLLFEMATEIIWLGHACFLIKTGGISILVDPFLSNPFVANSCLDLM